MIKPAVPINILNFTSQSQTQLALSLDNVTVSYKDKIALNQLSGKIKRGSTTAIVGPNGGGKSTFLKTLLQLVPVTQGKIHFHDNSQHSIAYLSQQCEIDQSFPLTVGDVVASGHYQHKGFFQKLNDDALELVKSALEQVGMLGCIGRSLNTLSGGQFQRVLFARLIVQNAEIILLDEPFTAIDAYTIADLLKIIKMWHHQEKTILIVCHDLDLVQENFPETLLLAQCPLAWGNTKEVLTPENLRAAKKIALTLESCAHLPQTNVLGELHL